MTQTPLTQVSSSPIPHEDGAVPGSRLTIRQLAEEHYSVIYGYSYRLSGSAADAEDLVQQTFLIAQQRLDQVREHAKVVGWLCAIARSCYLKSHRRQRPVPASHLELNVDEIPDASTIESPVDQEQLQHALDQLADDYKLVLMMFYFEDLSYKEIAAALEVPMGTVMSRLARAKGHLRQLLTAPAHLTP